MKQTSDEYLASITVGERRPHNSTVFLAESDPAWPGLYSTLAALIRDALADRRVSVEHVGSTAVPGIPAKPIIDVLLVVADASDEASYVQPMESRGFRLHLREPDWFEHRLFKATAPDANIHVFSEGCPEIERMLRFRDHLRECIEDRERYVAEKRRLAAQVWRHRQHYADAKSGVIESILQGVGPA